MINAQAITLRKKKLAVLILDARLASGRTVEECARVLGISAEAFEAFERGERSPSLPELEMLAYFLNIPLKHFWGSTALTANGTPSEKHKKAHRILELRQRIIGVILRKVRVDNNLSLDELSNRVDLPASQLENYELGNDPIPLPALELLVGALGRSLQEFQDTHGPIGGWIREQRATQQILDMPTNLQEFVSRPINRPYLELAERLSEMSVEKLRAVAEGLLEITL
ncbi:MAG: helix-turn-helix transcriptional regulator [Anaerolineales bacterium]